MPDSFDQMFATSARVQLRATTAELIALATERAALDPSVFESSPPFFWQAEISSDRLDAYYTRMHAGTTLRNYAADAAAGVAFLEGHNRWTLPFGRSLSGAWEATADDGATARVLADFYTIPGLSVNAYRTTDQVITGMRAGIIADVSVGFYGGRHVCDLCGGDLMDWRACPHWPGMSYEITDPATGQSRTVTATATVFDARLAEVSAVYDGATPGAVILKAQGAAEAGDIPERVAALITTRYRVALPDRRLVVPGTPLAAPPAPAPTPQEPPMELLPQLRALLGLADDDPDDHILDRTRAALAAAEEPAAIRGALGLADDADLSTALPAIRVQAADGRAYRDATIAEALAQAVRALGAEAEARYAPVLAGLDLPAIRAMGADWAAVARERLPAGRRSVDAPEATPAPTDPATPPAAAYRAG